MFFGFNDYVFQKIWFVFVKIVDGEGNKFEMLGFGLVKEGQCIGKVQVVLLVVYDFFYIYDE